MTNIIPTPVWTLVDTVGKPIVGASVYTYVAGTLTSKATYQDYGQTSQNANPVVTDASGRTPAMWGTGDYRVIVKDASNVLLYDQVTRTGLPESAVSAVMLPVLGAATLAQARTLMGIDTAIQSGISSIVATLIAQEAGARAAADAAEANARAAADASLQTQITGFFNGYTAEVASLQNQINALSASIGSLSAGSGMFLQTGTSTSDTWGNLIVNYTPFAHNLWQFSIVPTNPLDSFYFFDMWWNLGLGIFTAVDNHNGLAQGSAAYNDPGTGLTTTVPNAGFTWYAIGY